MMANSTATAIGTMAFHELLMEIADRALPGSLFSCIAIPFVAPQRFGSSRHPVMFDGGVIPFKTGARPIRHDRHPIDDPQRLLDDRVCPIDILQPMGCRR